jgi:hypothetical protein
VILSVRPVSKSCLISSSDISRLAIFLLIIKPQSHLYDQAVLLIILPHFGHLSSVFSGAVVDVFGADSVNSNTTFLSLSSTNAVSNDLPDVDLNPLIVPVEPFSSNFLTCASVIFL